MNLWILAVSAALVVQVSALVPTCQPSDPHGYCISQGVDNCAPEDRLITSLTDQCRTSSRFSPDHNDILIPPKWKLLFDSYDYESLVGPVFLSREFDNDGDVSADQWEDRGGICQRGLRVCAHTLGAQDNWVFSPHIKYPPGSTTLGGGLPTEIYLKVSFRFTQCNSPCVNNFADLYRYDTNSIASESVRTDRNNYLTSLFGTGTEMTTSRLDQTGSSGTVSETRTLAITSSRTNGFYFGIRDSGNCGQINRIYFYYTPCKERQDGLVNYPELVRPPNGSPPNEGMACCAPNSHPNTSLTFRAHSAINEICEHNVRCECDAGYGLNEDRTECEVCPAGTYSSNETCLDCPMNTVMDVEGVPMCQCLDGFRRPTPDLSLDCTPLSDPVKNLRVTTTTSTSVTLLWTRPEVTGNDLYYFIVYSDPDNTGSFIISNPNYVNSELTVSYTVPNLRPNTPYTIRVTTHNGVTDQDTENEALRRVDLPIRTLEGVPSVPRDVQVFSGVVVWGPPAEPNGVITGYQLRFSGSFTRTFVSKLPSESYHVVTDDNILNLGRNIQVSVQARTSAGPGSYSSSIPYIAGDTSPEPSTCPPIPSPTTCPEITCTPTMLPTTCPPPTCPTTEPCPLITFPPPSTTCPPEQGDVYFMLRGITYTDGDTVMITDIGEGDDALLCVTDNTECCRPPDDGEFFYPDGTAVGFSTSNSLYRNREEQSIRLNRRNDATSPLGKYRCTIPDTSGVTRSIIINIVSPMMTCPTLPPPTDSPIVTATTCPPTPTCSPCTEATCPTCPPTVPPSSCPTCPPTMAPPTCTPTESSTSCPVTTCPPPPTTCPPDQGDVYFMLRGITYTNGDIVMITDIGEGDDALLCVTGNTECCDPPDDGEFFYPDGTAVGFSSTNSLYRNREEQFIRLNRRNGVTSPLGKYRCAIPDTSGVTRSIIINIVSPMTTFPPPTDFPTTSCPPTPTCTEASCPSCPPTVSPPTCTETSCPTCPPTVSPPTCTETSCPTCPPTPIPMIPITPPSSNSTDTDPVLCSTQSAAASGYVDGIYVAVGIIVTFLTTTIIVALLVIVLSWLFITCRIKSGYYSLNTKKQHKY